MKNTEIRNLKDTELKERISAERSNIQKMRFAHTISSLENPNQLKESKKLVARLITEFRTRELKNNK